MPHLFTCPHCQAKTLVDDRYSGQSGRCVTCGSAIELPRFAPSPATPPQTASSGSAAAANRSGGISPLGRRLIAAAVCLVLIGCAAVVVLRYASPAVATLQSTRMRAQSLRNIERIASALNAYAADHGTYPPARIDSPDGKPMHSWRVLILPYLGETDLFARYDLNQTWDSPANLELAASVPAVYRQQGSAPYSTGSQYALVTGAGTLFPPAPPGGAGALGPSDVRDDPALTLLVVESLPLTAAPISWLQPHDLAIADMQGVIGASSGREIGGASEGGAIVATVDGRGHFLDERTSPLSVMALITIAGGEPLADDLLDR